ncbi:hypothetical protein G9F31_09380 [Acinetobacter sp. 187]|uniref:hypothetical protein n=1 Tax=Acinetobacter lanii TaxID=2715163 RepID=UPI001407A4D7|nr:hypothetical protein [Acinetobacter lanii]NHC03980.1 hypothetical protein [Acinetobacter lanii]
MTLKSIALVCLFTPIVLTACSKQESAPAAQQTSASEAESQSSDQLTPEQQAAIDALDQPVLDEKNTDIPESVANAPADQATASTETQAAAAH